MNKSVAVLIPCYNEAQTIEKVVRDFHEVLPDAVVYVYNNNSSDDTASIAQKAGAVVRNEYKQGKGNVIRSMFRDINADCYLMVDGDDTYPAQAAPQMAQLILDGKADMVNGDRLSSTYFTENKRMFHNSGNKVVRGLINHLFGTKVCDIMTGYRAFNKKFVKSFPVLSKGFEIETEMTIFAVDHNFLIREIPVDYRDRQAGSVSKLSTFSDGRKVLKTIFMLFRDYKPFSFFGLIALLLLIISILCFIPVGMEYVRTGLVPRVPTLIASITALICSALSFAVALILDVIAKKDRQMFEMNMNLMQELHNLDQKNQ